jgi:PQQ-dependent dehydrogenase (methanol/ethanol family)
MLFGRAVTVRERFPIAFIALALSTATLGAQQRTADALTNPFAGQPAEVAAGKKLYGQTCQACHGGDARGDRGPALATGSFRHGSQDQDLFQNIRTGIPGTQMPAFSTLPTDSVWRIITYLRNLSGADTAANETIPGNPAAGEKLFFGKAACATCHQVNAHGVPVATDLSDAGRNSIESLKQNILDPNTPKGRAPHGQRISVSVTVKLKDGRELRGLRRAEDTFSLLLTDLTGRTFVLAKTDVASSQDDSKSLMPDDYASRLSAPEIDDLVAYLKSSKERDLTKTITADIPGGLTYERLRNSKAEPQNWLTYWGDYDGTHASALNQITTTNVSLLRAAWSMQLPGDSVLESMPLVVDGVVYTGGAPDGVHAFDAQTGMQIWNYERKQKAVNPYHNNPFNRGVAVLGNRVFIGTLDAALVALDARTGLPLWETQVADTLKGYSLTGAPLAVKDKIIVGISGGEFGIRGFIDAYDAVTGKRLWRFNTIPGPGEFGNETWAGDSWKRGAGGAWMTGSYDPDSDTLYWGIGNPGPDLNHEVRRGDNLFSCSVVALDVNTGQRKWHYQFSPADAHDWDATEDLILADKPFHGQPRKLVMQANRNGMFYVLDRGDGKFLLGKPFVEQSWNKGFDENGRPIFTPGWESSAQGTTVYPSLAGGTNWQAPSFDRQNGWLYVAFIEMGMHTASVPIEYEEGRQYMGGRPSFGVGGGKPSAGIRAIDTETGKVQWEYLIASGSLSAGVLSTRGGLLFAASSEGNLIALDSKTGKYLWRFQTGGTIATSPISYAINGKQFVAVAAGNVLYSFSLPD